MKAFTHYITSAEFERRYEERDEICVLAQGLADDAMGKGYRLSHKKEFIRQRYVDLATDLIEKLKRHGLKIVHINEEYNDKNT
jgi:hypothetical protein